MAFDRDDLYDAINLFKYSRVGQGCHAFAKEPAHLKTKYSRLAPKVVSKLLELWSKSEIGFAKLRGRLGEAVTSGGRGADLRVNAWIRDSNDFVTLSLILGHEGAHFVIDNLNGFEEEIACRTLATLYFRDLKQGVEIAMRKGSVKKRFVAAQMNKSFYGIYDAQSAFLDAQKLPDLIMGNKEYYQHLTADWIVKSIDWWGGIANRWPETKARYLAQLEQSGWPRYQYDLKTRDVALRLLESYPRAGKDKERQDMIKLVGKSYADPSEGPKALRRMFKTALTPDQAKRWRAIEPRLS